MNECETWNIIIIIIIIYYLNETYLIINVNELHGLK